MYEVITLLCWFWFHCITTSLASHMETQKLVFFEGLFGFPPFSLLYPTGTFNQTFVWLNRSKSGIAAQKASVQSQTNKLQLQVKFTIKCAAVGMKAEFHDNRLRVVSF